MKNIISLLISCITLTACMTKEEPVISASERSRLNAMSCEALSAENLDYLLTLQNERSHYKNKNYFSQVGDMFENNSPEMKKMEELRRHYNETAQIYNERRCGAYIDKMQRDVPMRHYDAY